MLRSTSCLVALVGVGVLSGCGSNRPPTLKQGEVVRAFASAGLPVPNCGAELGTKVIECADHSILLFPDVKVVGVEVFPTVRFARDYAMGIGGSTGVRPFGRVGNVVVIAVSKLSGRQRHQIDRAMSLMRSDLRQ